MTTQVSIKNENQGAPFADWSVELLVDGSVVHTLEPGASHQLSLWHDGKELTVREKKKEV